MTQLRSLGRHGQWKYLGAMLLVAATAVPGQSAQVVMVEEHWELRLGQPDADRSAPQATMLMSPKGEIDGPHFLFTLNHVTALAYRPGGIQVQAWDGDIFVDERTADQDATLFNDDEVVHWVQRLSIQDGTLTFQVVDGASETWGSFGGDQLTVSQPTTLTGLNSYLPAVSLTESQVGYAENRVTSLVLTKLVWVTDDGQVHEQSAPIPLDTSLDP